MLPLIVTAAIIRKDGKILITRRPGGTRFAGLWEFPGGKLEANESPEVGLAREIREELALDIKVGKIVDVIYHCYDWGPVLLLAYDCVPLGTTILNREVEEHRWVDSVELPSFTFLPADIPLLARLQELFTE
ncbi:MAG: (deoxy)nucleoside triphosphate pyrophosphohydrolase [Desulfuromonas sp.]|nr:MAG: (deoxy)nucleoside triphosphate pyrophosphohydrolase [Desulfuromonas sp.]